MRVALLALMLAFGGCGLFPSAADRAMQKSPGFRAGYDDGCAAASTTGANPREGPYRDEASYENDRAYHAGWSSGFAVCRSQSYGSPAANPPVSAIPH